LSSARALGERVAIVDGKVTVDVPYVALDSFETDTLGRLYYRVTGVQGEFVSGYEDLPDLPRSARSDVYPALVHFFMLNIRGNRCVWRRCISQCMTTRCAVLRWWKWRKHWMHAVAYRAKF
jgi:hypothetical protein